MKIKNKLFVNFISIWLLFVALSGGVAYLLNKQGNMVDSVIAQNIQTVSMLNDLIVQLEKTRRYEKEYFIYIGDMVKKKKYTREWNDSMNMVFRLLGQVGTNSAQLFSDAEIKSFAIWEESAKFYFSEFNKILDEYKDVNYLGEKAADASKELTVKANTAIKDGKNALKVIFLDIADIKKRKSEQLNWGQSQMKKQSMFILYLAIAVTVISAILMLIIIGVINKSIFSNLRGITSKTTSMAQGDFNVNFDRSGIEELDELSNMLTEIKIKLLRKKS